jgi:hypothetical protein
MKTLIRWAFALVGLIPLTFHLHAAHIIGGYLSYTCHGPYDYNFTMTLFRDCNGSGAPFDSAPGAQLPATVTIYRGIEQTPYEILQLDPPVITDLEFEGDCQWAPICIQKGVYEFQLYLPPTSEPFHITYQRCCLSNTLTNTIDPAGTGLTFTIDLTPEARNVCNNSPVFEGPLFVCSQVNQPALFPHNATDTDGDSLVYEFCAPYMGGGDNQIDPYDSLGVAPNPDLPPPYMPIAFVPPSSSPIPIPGLALDSLSGTISGTPDIAGLYLYAICVSEYRDGQLLSRTQFVMRNVVDLFSAAEESLHGYQPVVYPNPASSTIHLSLPGPCEAYNIQLSSLDGKVAKRVNCAAKEIDVADIQDGWYFVRIISEHFVRVEKILIIHD